MIERELCPVCGNAHLEDYPEGYYLDPIHSDDTEHGVAFVPAPCFNRVLSELDDVYATLAFIQRHISLATEYWQITTGLKSVNPDLGKLLGWFMSERIRLISLLDNSSRNDCL